MQLITFWEDQIHNKPNIIKNILLSKLGIYETRIYARKCVIKDVSSEDANKFLNKCHLQGSVVGSVRIGLYYDNELVSIMVFGKKRKALGNKNVNGEWELYRYCNKGGVQVVGGASKLFNHFLKTHPNCVIESFSSNDISNGELYKHLKFTNKGTQKKSYWYIDKKTLQRYHRFSYRKDVLIKRGFDKNATEAEITSKMELYKIYDSGQQKWIYNLHR